MKWKKFYAMGTEIVISVFVEDGKEYVLDDAWNEVVNFERRFSRFISGNELDAFNKFSNNKNSDLQIEVSHFMADILNEAQKMHKETNGVFDPTIIGSLEGVGYDKSFVETHSDDGKVDFNDIKEKFKKRPRIEEIKISGNFVSVPEKFRIDLGGIGKGYIVDYLAKNIFTDIENFWISAGGDLFVKGGGIDGGGWKIGIQDPHNQEKETFAVRAKKDGMGIATSGIFKRKGVKGGYEWHHLIDPRTGFPAENNILAVTAVSSSAQRADVFAKTVLILGAEEGMKFIDGKDDSACVVFFKDKGFVMSRNALKYF